MTSVNETVERTVDKVARVSDVAHFRLRIAAARRDITIGELATAIVLAALPPEKGEPEDESIGAE